ncbi:hypothetical protein D3C75_444500 [compost metagenome]
MDFVEIEVLKLQFGFLQNAWNGIGPRHQQAFTLIDVIDGSNFTRADECLNWKPASERPFF